MSRGRTNTQHIVGVQVMFVADLFFGFGNEAAFLPRPLYIGLELETRWRHIRLVH